MAFSFIYCKFEFDLVPVSVSVPVSSTGSVLSDLNHIFLLQLKKKESIPMP